MMIIPYDKNTIDNNMDAVISILDTADDLFEQLYHHRSTNNTFERLFNLILDEITHGYYPKPNTRASYIERRTIAYMQNYILFDISVHTHNHRFIPYLRSYLILKHRMAPTK